MYRYIILLFLLTGMGLTLPAQTPSYDIKGRNLYQIKRDFDNYFDQQARIYGWNRLISEEGSEYNQYRKWLSYWEPRLAPHGDFESYFMAEQSVVTHAKRMGNRSSVDPWDEVGPTQRPQGGISSIGNGGCEKGIGPVEFLTFHPDNNEWMLCGSQSGGLFFSTNGGEQWLNSGSDDWWHSACRSAVFHPTQTNTWYAASHVTGGNAIVGFEGGIWKTTSAGTAWDRIASTADLGLGYWGSIREVVIDPDNPMVFFVLTSNKLLRTSNVLAPSINWVTPSGMADQYINDLEFQPGNPQNVFASTESTNGVWKFKWSNDNGVNWSDIPGQPSLSNATWYTIETSKADPDYIYCVMGIFGSSSSQIWKYQVSTQNWSMLSSGHSISFGQAHGFGVSQHVPDKLAITRNDRYQTLVGGVWTNYTSSNPNDLSYHVDIEDIVGHPNNPDELWIANHGGVHKSTDFGETWENMSVGLGIAEVIGMSTSQSTGDFVSIGTYHDGTILTVSPHTVNWTPDWNTIHAGDGQWPLIDYSDPQHMWASSQMCGSWRYSSNTGASFSSASYYQPTWNLFGELNTEDPKVLFSNSGANLSCSSNGSEVSRSTNRGASGSYELISDFGNNFGYTNYLVRRIATSHSDPDILYVHLYDAANLEHHIFKTTKANASAATVIGDWTQMISPQPSKWIADLDVDPVDPNVVYITYSSTVSGTWVSAQGSEMVYRMDYSLNPGDPGWATDLTLNLPNIGVGNGGLELERGSNGGIYIGTDFGVYYTNNVFLGNGTKWIKFGDLPHVPLNDLEISYAINRIRVGSFGRGVWEHDLYCPDDISLTETGTYTSDEFLEAQEDILSVATVPSPREIVYRAGIEINLLPGFTVTAGGDFYAYIHACNQPGNTMKMDPSSGQGSPLYETEEEALIPVEKEINFRVYPNPNEGSFSLEASGIPVEELQVRIFNTMGVLVKENLKLTSAITQFDLDVPKGIYFVVLSFDGKQTTLKILVE